jgi:RimJ/RimL family protein N-acetyltransferase
VNRGASKNNFLSVQVRLDAGIRGKGAHEKIARWKRDAALASLLMARPAKLTATQASAWLHANQSDQNQRIWGIVHSRGGLIGLARLMFIDFQSGTAELGIYIGDRVWRGRGLGEKAMTLLLREGFAHLGLHRIWLKVASSNKRAIACYKKFGFRKEGILKGHFKNGHGRQDAWVMALLKPSYKEATPSR